MDIGQPLTVTSQSTGLPLTSGAALHRAQARVSSRRALMALTGLVLCGALVALGAAATATLLPQTIRPVPPALAGAFRGLGLNLHVAGAIVAMTAMFVAYVIVVRLSDELSPRTILAAIAALFTLMMLAPPLISTDVFSYQAYARIGSVYATNPYLRGPHAIALDPIFPYVGAWWSYIPSAYGPVFTLFSYLLAPLSIAASVFAYKGIAALACLGIVTMVWHCARLRGTDPVRAAALVGLNPLLVVYGLGGGHNDLLMLAAVVGAVYAVLLSRERLGGGLSVLALAIKLTGGLILPFAIAAGGPGRARGRRRDLLAGAAAALAMVAALTYGFFGFGAFNMLATIDRSQSERSWRSIPGVISDGLRLPTVGHVASYVLAGAFVLICWHLLARVWQGRTDWLAGAGWATLALLAASTTVMPWYVSWSLPLAALGNDRRLVRGAVVMTGIVLGLQLGGAIPSWSFL
jgi:alpha-1,6-mannosyltransferase